MSELKQSPHASPFSRDTSAWLRNLLGVGTLIVFCFFIWSSFDLMHKSRNTLYLSEQQAILTTEKMAHSIHDHLKELILAADELAENLAGMPLDQEAVEFTLKKSALNHAGYYALGVAFDLYQISPQLRLFAPFLRKNATTYQLDRLDQHYDYTGNAVYGDRNSNARNWYQHASTGRSGWLEPYYDLAYQQVTIKYVTPLRAHAQSEDLKKGVVFLDIGIEWFRHHIENHDVGDNGYAIIVNNNGQIIYHGLKGPKKIISELHQSISPSYLADFSTGSPGINELTGRSAWLHKFPIGETGWYVLTVMNTELSNKNLFYNQPDHPVIHKSDIHYWILTTVILLLMIYSWIALIKHQHSITHLLRHAFIFSLLLTLGIITIWINEYFAASPVQNNSLTLSNRAIVEQFQDDYTISALNESKHPPFYVPTGLFIQSIEFLNASNTAVSGYVWQRYPKSYEESIEPGVIFPEAIQTALTEAYTHEENNEIVKGWYFEVTLRETFDYRGYPFDRQFLWIRLWHKEFTKNIILVPDFKAFDSLNPSTLPGVEKDFVLSEWSLSRAYFDIRINKYNSNFGNTRFTSHDKMPELYFNIEISRNILNPFIAHLFPLAVVLLMLYGIVLTISKQETNLTITGFNVSAVIAACSALFFILLIMHVQLRDELAVNTIVYLEYFYLISYVTILMVTVNTVLFSYDPPLPILAFKDNFIPKLIYWPVLLLWIFLITAILFS
ncbi:cache domain-containing protein [Nitrosomonas sp. sh817]|uniref:cache domain-containing protein n=1 Tax=Nitrosomonas sp. sh817 TaxID=3070658 RepID=UPI0027DC03BF|nr:cache domain-containing protein [Nitrosomonas sp. sh817]WMJ09973.1 cache domain-containing protein [Nitrosomonas sp. sh817]